ncbi:alpha/beta hydrolase [Mycolicibacterium tusciae]|uniref:alpha/beta hydrolase n=1 Tax=Mycolicibacterium tusciae TaxID=75922 RepID=UPI00024A369B|nr:alpha/beta hydrolase [Mycolicibacterium tusciae]
MRRLAIVAAIVALVASGLLAFVWSQQRQLIYFPSPGPVPPAVAMLPNGQDLVLETDDGIRLGAWYFPVSGGGPAVLVCNGNGGDRSDRVELAAALNRMGLSVLLFDYRGYGGNAGKPSEDGTTADARAAQAWLAVQPGVEKIVYFGESLGAAVAVGLAIERAPAALILRSPFTSLTDVGAMHYPWLPVRLLLTDRYPSIDRIGSVHVPLMVIAGDRDDIVPEALSRRLFDAANEPKRYVVVPGAGHNDQELLDGRQMLADIDGFLSSTFGS